MILDGTLPPDFTVPDPTDVAALMPDELPLDALSSDEEDDAVEDENLPLDLPDEDEASKSEGPAD